MNKCDCYKEGERLEISKFKGIPFGKIVKYNYCNGTKEQDVCSCGGNKIKCDFYPKVREEALNEIKGNDMEIKTEVNVEKLIARFEDMAKRNSLLTGGSVTQKDLLIQIVGTIMVEAMSV